MSRPSHGYTKSSAKTCPTRSAYTLTSDVCYVLVPNTTARLGLNITTIVRCQEAILYTSLLVCLVYVKHLLLSNPLAHHRAPSASHLLPLPHPIRPADPPWRCNISGALNNSVRPSCFIAAALSLVRVRVVLESLAAVDAGQRPSRRPRSLTVTRTI